LFSKIFERAQVIKCLQEYGVGQTAAEYINGAFNGQKGFKAKQNLIFFTPNCKI
jgi:hypothetical protein